MGTVAAALHTVRQRILAAEAVYGRAPGSVLLLAVSKTRPAQDVRAAFDAGQRAFGENQLQDAMPKVEALAGDPVEWHFIGPLQSNKSRPVAEHFDWVQSVDRRKIAERLSAQRPTDRPDLNVCVQFNVSGEASKSGVSRPELEDLCHAIVALPRLRLRGLMAIPAPSTVFAEQRRALAEVAEAYATMQAAGFELDTLSMGMTDDLEAAVAEGSTMVRIGTAIFGARRAP